MEDREFEKQDRFLTVMLVITYMLLGFTLGIALCKFCPGFWEWIV